MGVFSCTGACAKYSVLVINLLTFIAGFVITCIALSMLISNDSWTWFDGITTESGDPLIELALYAMMIAGVLLFVLGFLGCCGAWKENKWMLCLYVLFMLTMIILQITGATLALIFRSEVSIDDVFRMAMQDAIMYDYGVNNNSEATVSWDAMQHDLQCCGSLGYEDYEKSAYYNETNNIVPETCCSVTTLDDEGKPVIDESEYTACKLAVSINVFNDTLSDLYYKDGCYYELKDWVDENTAIIIGILFGLAVVQIFIYLPFIGYPAAKSYKLWRKKCLDICLTCCVRGNLKEIRRQHKQVPEFELDQMGTVVEIDSEMARKRALTGESLGPNVGLSQQRSCDSPVLSGANARTNVGQYGPNVGYRLGLGQNGAILEANIGVKQKETGDNSVQNGPTPVFNIALGRKVAGVGPYVEFGQNKADAESNVDIEQNKTGDTPIQDATSDIEPEKIAIEELNVDLESNGCIELGQKGAIVGAVEETNTVKILGTEQKFSNVDTRSANTEGEVIVDTDHLTEQQELALNTNAEMAQNKETEGTYV